MVWRLNECFLQDRHVAAIEGAREEATLLLRNFYKVWEKVFMFPALYLLGFETQVAHTGENNANLRAYIFFFYLTLV